MAFDGNVDAGVGYQHLASVVQLRNRLRPQLVLIGVEVDVFEREARAGRVDVVDVEILGDGSRVVGRHRHGKFLRFDVLTVLAHGHLVGTARKHGHLVSAIGLADVAEAQGRFVGLGTAEHQLHPRNDRRAVALREHLTNDVGVFDVVDGVDVLLAVAANAVRAQVGVRAIGAQAVVGVVVGGVDGVAHVLRGTPLAGSLVVFRLEDVVAAHRVVAARREVQRLAVLAHERAVVVVLGVDVGPERAGWAKVAPRHAGRLVEVKRAVFGVFAGGKNQGQSVGRDVGIAFVGLRVDVAVHGLRHAPIAPRLVRHENVAVVVVAVHQQLGVVVEQLRRRVVTLTVEHAAQRAGLLPVLVVDTSSFEDIFVVLAVGSNAFVFTIRNLAGSAGHRLAPRGKDEQLVIGRDNRAVLRVLRVDGRAEVLDKNVLGRVELHLGVFAVLNELGQLFFALVVLLQRGVVGLKVGHGLVEVVVKVVDPAEPVFHRFINLGLNLLGLVDVVAGFLLVERHVRDARVEQRSGVIRVFGEHLLVVRDGSTVIILLEELVAGFEVLARALRGGRVGQGRGEGNSARRL